MNKFLLLFAVVFSTAVFCQTTDTVTRQIEISGVTYRLNKAWYSQLSLGVNFEAKKPSWYTNLALSVNIFDGYKRSGVVGTIYSFSIGKSYQHIRGHFFGTIGLNTGPYLGIVTFDNYFTRYFGLSFIPKLEIGYNTRSIVISTGCYFSAGVGTFQQFNNGIEGPHYLKIIGALNPYLKLILK